MNLKTKSIYYKAIHYLRRGEVLSGIENYSVPGLYSLVFKNRESDKIGMLRMFYCGPSCTSLYSIQSTEDFSLLPHNHKHDAVLYRLTGKPRNVTLRFTREGNSEVHEYLFKSDYSSDQSLEFRRNRHASFYETDIKDSGLFLDSTLAHTIVASPGDSWVVEELRLKSITTNHYSLRMIDKLPSEGLYIPMTSERIKKVSDEINSLMKLENRHVGTHTKESDWKWAPWREE